jgi:SAM-dependent methyltransferase
MDGPPDGLDEEREPRAGAAMNPPLDDAYFAMVDETTSSSAVAIAESITNCLAPRSVMDVGCGTGVLLDELRARGVEARGFEYSAVALAYCRQRGLDVAQFDVERDELPEYFNRSDVAVSMEVGQLLAPEYSDRYVSLLCRLANTVVFSSAVPGQDRVDSVNAQRHEYWIRKFAANGFHHDEALSAEWRCAWKTARVAKWFRRNVMVFRKTR